MKNLYYIISILLLIACSTKQTKSTSSETIIVPNDTTITYDLENISSEGAEVVARYVNGIIDKCEIGIYGEMGKSIIIYYFVDNQIKVTEKDYHYEVEFMLVADKDIKLVKDFSYTMDFNGVPLEKVSFDRVDVFQEFKQIVPFTLQ